MEGKDCHTSAWFQSSGEFFHKIIENLEFPVYINTACVLVTGWNYMAALKTVYAPLNTYRKVIIYSMQVIFFGAAVVLQNLLTLGSLEFGMIILVFLLMTFSPILIDVITAWIRNIYSRSLDKGEQGKFATFIDKLRK